MTLYFYGIEIRYNEADEREYSISRKEVEARETPKLYLPATKEHGFPHYLTRLPKDKVDTGEVDGGYLILTKPDDEVARTVWRKYHEESAETYTRRAEEFTKRAAELRKIAATL